MPAAFERKVLHYLRWMHPDQGGERQILADAVSPSSIRSTCERRRCVAPTVRVMPTSRLANRSAIASLKKQNHQMLPPAIRAWECLQDGSDLEIRGLGKRLFNDRA
jgi:hypothetical protein